jgi:hypothetical protein
MMAAAPPAAEPLAAGHLLLSSQAFKFLNYSKSILKKHVG